MPTQSIQHESYLNTQDTGGSYADPNPNLGPGTTVTQGINSGITMTGPNAGIDVGATGYFRGGKTGYDTGVGFWLGVDDDYKEKVAIGNPSANTFNFDGTYIDAQMRNLELTGTTLKTPASFIIDPATHGDNTGNVTIQGSLRVFSDHGGTGLITVSGSATGSNEGGEIRIATAADFDSTYDFYRIDAHQDDLRIGRAGQTDFKIHGADGKVEVANDLLVVGNLQVDGTTTTINSTVMTVDDKNIVLASGAANSAAADGGGITIDGASATLTWAAGTSRWTTSHGLTSGGPLIPSADDTHDLGASGSEWKDLYIDGVAYIDNLQAEVGGHLLPTTDDTFDLGSSTKEWKDLYLDGVAYIDNLQAEAGAHFLPTTDDSFDLGSSTKEWRNLYLDGTAYIDSLDLHDLTIGGSITGHLLPVSDDTFDLGGPDKQWRNLYVDGTAYVDNIDIDASGRIYGHLIPGNDNVYDLGTLSLSWRNLFVKGVATIEKLDDLTSGINAHAFPSIHNTYDLGKSTFRWKDLFLEGDADIDGTLNVEGAATVGSLIAGGQTVIDSSGNVTLTGTPTAPTPASNDNSTKVATTAYVQTNISDLKLPYDLEAGDPNSGTGHYIRLKNSNSQQLGAVLLQQGSGITLSRSGDEITIASSSSGSSTAMQDSDGDTKIQVEESSDEDRIRFDTTGTERMVIGSAASGGNNFDGVVALSADSPFLLLKAPETGAEGGEIRIENSGVYDSGSYRDFWRIDSSSGNLRIGRAAEQGAYFGGTTSLLNLPAGVKLKPSQTTLDHYEEGSWTVQIADASSGGNQATIGSNSTGSYVRIGSIVTIACPALNINPSGLNSSNSLFIRNFPFSISSTNTCVFTAPFNMSAVPNTDISEESYVLGIPGESYVNLVKRTSTAELVLTSSILKTNNTSGLRFSLTYFTDED